MALPSRAKGKATEKTQYLPALKDEDVPEPDPSIQKKQLFKTKESTEEKKAEEKTDVRAAITLPDRPGIGQPNRRSPCALLTNSFTMDLKHVDEIYIYEISFDDRYQPGSNRRARRLFQLMLEQHRPVTDRAATDYRQILVSVRQLTQYNTDTNIQVVYYEAGEQPPVPPHVVAAAYYIKVHYTKTLSLQALRQYLNNPSPPGGNPYGEKEEALNVLNLLMNRAPGQDLAIHKIGKTKIFNTSQPVEPPCLLQGGLEAYVGFEKSVRTSEAGCLLNVNATRSAFYLAIGVDQLIKLWAQCASVPPNRIPQASYTNAELVVLNRFLKGVRVRATYHPRRFYSIWRLARAPNPQTYPTAANIRFDIQEEGQPTRSTTVLAYFRDSKAIVVQLGL